MNNLYVTPTYFAILSIPLSSFWMYSREAILAWDYYSTSGKKQMTGMLAAPILIGSDSFICVVVIIFNLKERRLYLHETFLTEKIPEIAASSLVRGSDTASPQSQGSIAKILSNFLNNK